MKQLELNMHVARKHKQVQASTCKLQTAPLTVVRGNKDDSMPKPDERTPNVLEEGHGRKTLSNKNIVV